MEHEFRLSASLTGRLNRGITAARVDGEGHLLFTLSDGQELDLGCVRGPAGQIPVDALEKLEAAFRAASKALPRAGGTMEGTLNLGGHPLQGLRAPTADDDGATKAYVDAKGGITQDQAQRLANAVCLGNTYTEAEQRELQRMLGIYSGEGVGF